MGTLYTVFLWDTHPSDSRVDAIKGVGFDNREEALIAYEKPHSVFQQKEFDKAYYIELISNTNSPVNICRTRPLRKEEKQPSDK